MVSHRRAEATLVREQREQEKTLSGGEGRQIWRQPTQTGMRQSEALPSKSFALRRWLCGRRDRGRGGDKALATLAFRASNPGDTWRRGNCTSRDALEAKEEHQA